jgi:hypothetical protein
MRATHLSNVPVFREALALEEWLRSIREIFCKWK